MRWTATQSTQSCLLPKGYRLVDSTFSLIRKEMGTSCQLRIPSLNCSQELAIFLEILVPRIAQYSMANLIVAAKSVEKFQTVSLISDARNTNSFLDCSRFLALIWCIYASKSCCSSCASPGHLISPRDFKPSAIIWLFDINKRRSTFAKISSNNGPSPDP